MSPKSISALLSLIFLSFGNTALAQSGNLAEIRAHYQKITQKIKATEDEPGMESALYCNKIEENVYDASWRAVGMYHRKLEYWYDDVPGMACEEVNGLEACHLQMIRLTEQNGIGGYYAEFLFEDGVLVFCFMEHEGGQRRFYWEEGSLFRVQMDKDVLDSLDGDVKEEADMAWKDGMRYREDYIRLF